MTRPGDQKQQPLVKLGAGPDGSGLTLTGYPAAQESRVVRGTVKSSSVQVSSQKQDQENDDDQAEQSATIVRRSPPRAPTVVEASTAEEKHQHQDDQN